MTKSEISHLYDRACGKLETWRPGHAMNRWFASFCVMFLAIVWLLVVVVSAVFGIVTGNLFVLIVSILIASSGFATLYCIVFPD